MTYIPILKDETEQRNFGYTGGYIPILEGSNEQQMPERVGFFDKIKDKLIKTGAFVQEKILGAEGKTIPERIQKTAENFYGLLKDYLIEAPARATASLITKEEIKPETSVEQFFWGEESIKPIKQRMIEAKDVGEKVGEFVGEKIGLDKDFAGKIGEKVAPYAVLGLTLLDLTPFGGSKKTIIDELTKAKNIESVVDILKKAGVADDIAKKYAPELAKANKGEVVEKLLDNVIYDLRNTSFFDEEKTKVTFNKLKEVLKEAKTLRGKQEEIYKEERAQKLAKMIEMSKNVDGEEGYFARLAALKGEMKKVNFESIADKFTKEERDILFGAIWRNEHLSEWEKLPAAEGLSKLLGVKGGVVPTLSEIEKLSFVFPEEVMIEILKKRTAGEKIKDYLIQAYNLPRTVMAGFLDLSAVLLQNAMFSARHPVMTARNFVKSLKMFGSEKYFDLAMKDIVNRENFRLYKIGGLELTGMSPLVKMREETFMTPIVEKIPLIGGAFRATGRAWTGFLNKMRADVFDKMIENAKILGKDVNDERFLKNLAHFINIATGRGSLGKLERIAPVLSQGFFSARKLIATAQIINPVFYVKADPFVRKEALKTWLAYLGSGLLLLELAKMAGAEVGDDPNSTDFGKIKIGNTRISIFGSYQQLAVLFSRLLSGKMVSSTTGKIIELGEGQKPVTRLDIILNFFETKEHPTLSYLAGLLRGKDQIGRDFKWDEELLSRFIPMTFADTYDIIKEHGLVGVLGVIPIVLGAPTQTYGNVELIKGVDEFGEETTGIAQIPKIEHEILRKVFGKKPVISNSTSDVEIFYKKLINLPQEQALSILNEISEKNPKLADKIMEVHKRNVLGMTNDDILVKSKRIEGGERAREIIKRLRKLKDNNERAKLWEDYVKKGIITPAVNEQLLKLMKKEKWITQD